MTPGPVFAYRAFRNAFLGTPAAEKQTDDDEPKVAAQPLNPRRSRPSEKATDKNNEEKKLSFDEPQQLLPKPQQSSQAMGSPTKSILLTPGTAVARRKTVSFGEGVIDNERKKSNQPSPKKSAPVGTISQQWNAALAETTRRNRSKFTQSLLDARENKSNEENDLFDIVKTKTNSTSAKEAPRQTSAPEPLKKPTENTFDDNEIEIYEDADVTTNLEEPRSQSGIYWKSEYESYRAKTNQEIKKLIQYRAVAKSFARKKEMEAVRLTEQLKRQEDKVAEMERHVSKLAAGMAGSQDSNKEEMLKELSKQTALVLQYKQKSDSLRKTLEQHGVFEDGAKSNENDTSGIEQKLRETEAALQKANSLLKAAEQGTKDKELHELVAASEAKAKELERENISLKRNLARTKEEMSKYEDRRKAKEARLKQREQKLETRISEYSARLKETTKRHRESEDELRNTFATEKKQMQETIASLKQKLQAAGRVSNENLRREPSKRSTGTRNSQELDAVEDDVKQSHAKNPRASHHRQHSLLDDEVYHSNPEADVPLPSRIKQKHTASNTKHGSDIDFDQDEPLITFDDPTPRKPRSRILRRQQLHQRQQANGDDDLIPPSSPPLPEMESSIEIGPTIPKHLTREEPAVAPSPRPSMVYMSLSPRKSAALARRHSEKSIYSTLTHSRANPRATTSRVTTTTPSRLNRQLQLPNSVDELASSPKARLESMPPDRIAAAVARLKQKQRLAEGARTRGDGKENIWT